MIDLAIQFGEANVKVFCSSLPSPPPPQKEIIKEILIYTHRLGEAVTWERTDGCVYRGHLATLIFH